MKKVSEDVKLLDEELRKYDNDIDLLMKYLPNLPHESVPAGRSEKDNVEIKGGVKKIFRLSSQRSCSSGKNS